MSDENEGQSAPNDNLKELRHFAEEGKKAMAEAEQARRELAFVKAGVDTDSKLGKLLLRTYDGDLTVDAIKAEAAELGLFKSAPVEDAVDESERSQSRERGDLASGNSALSSEDTTDHPHEAALKAFEAARKNGDTRETAAGAAFAEILKAAHRGDQRIILP